MFNLLSDCCFPVRHRNGDISTIPFCDITRDLETNPVVDFALPRPDFQAAAYQLGIAWLQTALGPETDYEWEELFMKPPSPQVLSQGFEPYLDAFTLWRETGPAFMQDLQLDEGKTKSISILFIEAPGEQTLEKNTDHFIKRGQSEKLSPFATAMALFCLQINAPSGGSGHRTGLRGGGPLTTLALGNSLWESLWLNVLPQKLFLHEAQNPSQWSSRPKPEDIFPWLVPTLSSKPEHACIYKGQVHPLQVYWAMPRRIRLNPPCESPATCKLGGNPTSVYFDGFITKNYGNNYAGEWHHPLTPHYLDKDRQLLPRHGQPGTFAYQHWLGLVLAEESAKRGNIPATTVLHYISNRRNFMAKWVPEAATNGVQLWAFGYDMDNMKARAWIEARLPLIFPSENLEDFESSVIGFILAARQAAGNTQVAYTKATCGRQGKARGNVSFVQAHFWARTEAQFYKHLIELKDDPNRTDSAEAWLKYLFNSALTLFDELTQIRPLDCDAIDPQAWAKARSDLGKFTHFNGKKMRAFVDLAPSPKIKGGAT